MVEHQFWLAAPPRAAARARATCRGKFATVYTDPGYREWLDGNEEKAQLGAIALLKAHKPSLPANLREADIEIEIEVVVAKPKTTKRRRPGGDNDNYEKGVWDAMTKVGHWWQDDSQIVSNLTRKRWAYPGETEGYRVTVRFLDGAE